MNNECLLKKIMHKKMRTCLNGKLERRFPEDKASFVLMKDVASVTKWYGHD
jgi:hypothetical protein